MSEEKKEKPMLSAVQKRDFEELLLEHMNALYNLAYYMTRNRDDAYDLTQDASMRAYRFFHQYQQGTNFKAWIMTILRNTFINDYRKKKKAPPRVDFEIAEQIVGLPETSGAVEEIFGEALQVSIDQLSEELRTVIILHYVDGLAYKEIAEVMKCPIGTVMSRLHTARQYLKKKLIDIKNREEQLAHE